VEDKARQEKGPVEGADLVGDRSMMVMVEKMVVMMPTAGTGDRRGSDGENEKS
jgi:hypothetical protein